MILHQRAGETGRKPSPRRCVICGESLEGMRAHATVCSHACMTAKWRLQRKGVHP